jgi:hypothetical protein
MVPGHDEHRANVPQPYRPFQVWVRASLLAIVGLLIAVFVVAWRLDPYDANGRPLRLAVHEQLGMKPCHFYRKFHRPCPTCGMTTSFALLMKADVAASLRANPAGTLFALWLLALIPWGAISAVRGRWLFGRSIENWLLWGIIAIVGLALVRWLIIVGLPWLAGSG